MVYALNAEATLFLFLFKMAARARKEKGFYAALNKVSSVDIFPKTEKRKRKATGRLWEVERLVALRENATVSRILLLSWRVITAVCMGIEI